VAMSPKGASPRVRVEARQLQHWYRSLDQLLALKEQIEHALFLTLRNPFSLRASPAGGCSRAGPPFCGAEPVPAPEIAGMPPHQPARWGRSGRLRTYDGAGPSCRAGDGRAGGP
jgi:hypothetical protein